MAFCIETSILRELDWERDMLICTRNFGFGCNLVGEEEERVQTRLSRLGVRRVIRVSFGGVDLLILVCTRWGCAQGGPNAYLNRNLNWLVRAY